MSAFLRPWWTGLLVGGAFLGVLLVGAGGAAAVGTLPGQPANCSTGLFLTTSQSVGTAPLTVSFDLTSYWGVPVTTQWNFGDGAYLNGSGPGFLQPTHSYLEMGTYVATVEVTGGSRTGACSIGIAASPPALEVSIGHDVLSGLAPLTVHLEANVTGGSGTYDDAGWSFGDGNAASGLNLTYTYTNPGVYRATFSVVDTDGDQSNATVAIDVLASLPSPVTSGMGVGTLSLFGAGVAAIAAGAGTLLYVSG
ncbi:MAG: PKD domain-containing protein, partial [Thermoplasmata archaeon]